jgi:hypothetical protein
MWRQALNPYLSPAAVARWKPFAEEVVRATIDERIEAGSIDFAGPSAASNSRIRPPLSTDHVRRSGRIPCIRRNSKEAAADLPGEP